MLYCCFILPFLAVIDPNSFGLVISFLAWYFLKQAKILSNFSGFCRYFRIFPCDSLYFVYSPILLQCISKSQNLAARMKFNFFFKSVPFELIEKRLQTKVKIIYFPRVLKCARAWLQHACEGGLKTADLTKSTWKL